MTLGSLSSLFAYASLVCSASFWLGLSLSYFPGAPTIILSGMYWLAIQGTGIALAVISAVLNFEKRLWILAVCLAVVTFFFVMYVVGS